MLIQQFINRYISSSIEETNWLISKRLCVLLFEDFNGCSLKEINRERNVKYLLLRKTDVLKIFGKVHLSKRKFEEMH